MKILVTGDRNWSDRRLVVRALVQVALHFSYRRHFYLVHGDARGADRLAGEVAHDTLGWFVEAVPADWKQHGRAAGPIRNQKMLDDHLDIDLCIAFHDNLESSKGTKDMVTRARKVAPVAVVSHDLELDALKATLNHYWPSTTSP